MNDKIRAHMDLARECVYAKSGWEREHMLSQLEASAIALQAEQAGPGERCSYCDDTGDVHSIDGQWRGTCNCPAARASKGTSE